MSRASWTRRNRVARWLGAALLGAGVGAPAHAGQSDPSTERGRPRPEQTEARERERMARERERMAREREHMVREQIEARGVSDRRVLAALRKIPRHEFVPEAVRAHAYEDRPLPIGHRQTISQPYIVAIMSQLARIRPGARVLEVGTGSGYQAAVLAELAGEVFSIEIVPALAEHASATLARLGYERVRVRHGDGHAGWPEHAPFDAIVVTAAPEQVPPALHEQLAVGGRLVLPVGGARQELQVHTRRAQGIEVEEVFAVRFVPMTGGPGTSTTP